MKKSKSLIVLIIGLVLVLLGSILAQTFNTSMYSVDVSRIKFDTASGTLSGLLYMPKGASESDPRPTVVVTHGYLNSAEMQDANAIELSRRGYVVLALDMYDHGHSAANRDNTGQFFSFWPSAMFDAVTYMYQQPYVLKDAEGNGIIGVTGHSMGGFSSAMALWMDEQAYAAGQGYRMISCGLTEGADYQWSSMIGLTPEEADATGGGRILGKVAAQYDEFFFNADDATGGTVVKKNFVATTAGKTFLEQEDPEPGVWYDTADGGRRIIYQPAEIHPWNHFSRTTTGYAIEFYNTAFAGYNEDLNLLGPGNQIWLFKELAECVALVGFLAILLPLALLLMKLPFLKKAISGKPALTAPVKTLGGRVGSVALLIPTILIPAIIFSSVYDGDTSGEPMRWLGYAGIIAAVVGIVALVMTLTSKDENENRKGWLCGSVLVIVAGAVMWLMTSSKNFLVTGEVFQAPTVTSIVVWAIICACIGAIVMTAVYLLGKKKEQGVSLANYGLSGGVQSIAASLCVAVIVTVVGYALLFLVDMVFKTDFRIWTFAFKTFEPSTIPAALKYMPFFFIYYLEMGAAAVSNTSSEKLQGVWGYVLAALTNMGGIALWLVLQYGMLFATGTAFYPNQALGGILLFALVPTLAIASCFTKFLYEKTGNIYTGAFLNTILMTLMTVANTTVYFQR